MNSWTDTRGGATLQVGRSSPQGEPSTGKVLNVTDARSTSAPEGRAPSGLRPVVAVEHLVKHFRRSNGEVVPAVDDVSVEVQPGEFLVLLGPSGCGKTTLLRCIAGLERPDSGRILIEEDPQFCSESRVDLRPERRHLSMIFQSYALWPHMTAFQNVAFPLKSQKVAKSALADRVHRALDLVGIRELAQQHPAQMSGGQQQRVALARAVVANDPLVLFDEPLSNVDAKVREQLRLELVEMQRELGFAAVYVTHDQIEAMELATRIAVMERGKVAQLGTPREIYDAPTSRYVANFVGTVNELAGKVLERGPGGSAVIETSLGKVVSESVVGGIGVGDAVTVLCRPERTLMSREEPSAPNRWRAVLDTTLFAGSHVEQVIDLDGVRLRIRQPEDMCVEPGSEVWVSVAPGNVRVVGGHDGDATAA